MHDVRPTQLPRVHAGAARMRAPPQRLPEAVVVDGGPEFESIYFETLLARYGCAKKTRPAGRPRFGSVCERLFGTTNTRFVHTLLAILSSYGKAEK